MKTPINIRHEIDYLFYGIERFDHCNCEYCKNKRQLIKEASSIYAIKYFLKLLVINPAIWFYVGIIVGIIAGRMF